MIRKLPHPFHSLLTIMLFVALISIVPFTILTRVIYVSSLNKFKESLIDTKLVEIQSYANLLERDVEMVFSQMHDVLSSDVVITLPVHFDSSSMDSRFAEKIKTIQYSMRSKKNSTVLLDDMIIYYPKCKKHVTADSFKSYLRDEEEMLDSLIKQSQYGLTMIDDRIMYWLTSPFHYNEQDNRASIAVIGFISSQSMRRYLESYVSSESTSEFALCIGNDENMKMITSTSSVFAQTDIRSGGENNENKSYKYITNNGQDYLLTWSYLEDHQVLFYQLSTLEFISDSLTSYMQTMTILQMIVLLLSITSTLIMYLLIYRPIAHARKTFLKMESGDFSTRMGKSFYNEFQDMFRQFDSMSEHIQDLIEQEYQLNLLQAKAELKQLQYQISPHFLYNTYFILRGLLEEEEFEKASKLTDLIGTYLRYITVSSQEHAMLKEEVDHARSYAQIQQIRYSRHIKVIFGDCPAKYHNIKVPRLILQPLIENAFEHGVKKLIHNGIIKVEFMDETNKLIIKVEDNGGNITQEEIESLNHMLNSSECCKQESVALHNINKRIQLLYGEHSGLELSISELGGLCCRLILDIKDDLVAIYN
ncbi:MAG: sensor histidine kinase [Caldicoprobacterales bacterium]